jgi:acetyl esterase
MAVIDRFAARVVQVALGRLARPPASLLVAGAELPAPQRLTVPTNQGPVAVHIYRPTPNTGEAGERPLPVYLNFHGGGFIVRHPEYDDHLCRAVVTCTGGVVINVDYDVAPQRPFPVAPRQAFAVTQWVIANAAAQGWDAARVAVGGQSAGGNLAAGICLAARDQGTPTPILQILVYPVLDLATDPGTKVARTTKPLINPKIAKLFNNAYVPDVASRTDPLASPAWAADLTGLAPTVVITAEYDLLRDEGDAYATRLTRAGVPVSHHVIAGVDHAFTHVEPVEKAREALDLIVTALTSAWALDDPRPVATD